MKKIEWKHKPHKVSKDPAKPLLDAVSDALLEVTDAEMLEGLSVEEIQALQQPTLTKKEKKKRRERTKRSRASRRKQRKRRKGR